MNYLDVWKLLQSDILGCLQAHPVLSPRPGVLVEPGATEQQLTAKVTAAVGPGQDGKFGVGFLVLPIEEADDDNANLPQGPLKVPITVQFVENVTLNQGPRGTGLSLRYYTALAEKILKLYTPVGLGQPLTPVNPVVNHFTPDRDENLRVGQLNFRTAEADFLSYQKLDRPGIGVAGSSYPYTVTVTAPSAASIYYTLDGSHPWSGNPAATLYSGPITINNPCFFRCRAFAPGMGGSDANAVTFS